jgi:hypothetical protein
MLIHSIAFAFRCLVNFFQLVYFDKIHSDIHLHCEIICHITDSIFSHSFLQRVVSERGRPLRATMSVDQSLPASPTMSPAHHPCSTTVLLLVLHAGSVLGKCLRKIPCTTKLSIKLFNNAFSLKRDIQTLLPSVKNSRIHRCIHFFFLHYMVFA